MKNQIVLCILDGFGINPDKTANAIAAANTPFINKLIEDFPSSQLLTSGLDVGLPEGQMGNSEVGHMNIGSGRIIMQDLPKIDQSINDHSISTNKELISFINQLQLSKGSCHLLGLCSDGGVHSHSKHIIELTKILSSHNIKVFLHLFLDGRDTPPKSAAIFLNEILEELETTPLATIATISGRYYAMDRDNRWDRIKPAFEAITKGKGIQFTDSLTVLNKSYEQNITDEFVFPAVIGNYQGIHDNDGLLMANFRADRVRQMLTALLTEDFSYFDRIVKPKFVACIGMVEYSSILNNYIKPLFISDKLANTLPEIIAKQNLTQLRLAETEKYAHVTFFFNGGREEPFLHEDRILVPSPAVATYDLQPEMAAFQVTDKLIEAIESNKYDLIIVNYANSDMVGHTGNIKAAIKAIETLDICLSKVFSSLEAVDGKIIITADHGNAELMLDPSTHQPHTAHTMNPVPFILAGKSISKMQISLDHGKLCDIAPTILEIMHLDKPKEMTGKSLIRKGTT